VQKARGMLAGTSAPRSRSSTPSRTPNSPAQASGATLTLTSALLPRWRDTAASGHADDDLSAVYLSAVYLTA
jgi:hypothetical protein